MAEVDAQDEQEITSPTGAGIPHIGVFAGLSVVELFAPAGVREPLKVKLSRLDTSAAVFREHGADFLQKSNRRVGFLQKLQAGIL